MCSVELLPGNRRRAVPCLMVYALVIVGDGRAAGVHNGLAQVDIRVVEQDDCTARGMNLDGPCAGALNQGDDVLRGVP